MNWITKFIKPKIKSLFKKRSSNVEENLWTTCSCKNLIYIEDLDSNQKVCPKCGEHHKLTCKERFKTFFDNKEFELIETPLPKDDPLNFEDKKKYTDRLKSARKLTGQDDAILIGKGKIQEIDVIAGAQDFRFIGGSFGAASGEAFIAGAQSAIENGAIDVTCVATHPIMSGPAVERLSDSPIKKVIVCDTLIIPENKKFKKLEIVSVAKVFGESIRRVDSGKSLSSMFHF